MTFDPVVSDTNRYYDELDKQERLDSLRDEFVANRMEQTMHQKGDFYPFMPENVDEALLEHESVGLAMLGALHSGSDQLIGATLKELITDYWTKCASDEAWEIANDMTEQDFMDDER